jgi:hypothetical protein
MKKYLIVIAVAGTLFTSAVFAQTKITVPKDVKAAFESKYPDAKKVTWEKEKGNYEANWGGKSGEDTSVLYSPSGTFIEIAKAISVKQLPASALNYVKSHYKNSSINEAALVTDANGKVTYEVEVAHKDVVFDENGNFKKTEKE